MRFNGIEIIDNTIKIKKGVLYFNSNYISKKSIVNNTKRFFKKELGEIERNFNYSHTHNNDHICMLSHDRKKLALVVFNTVGHYIDINIICSKSDIQHFNTIKELYNYKQNKKG